MRVRDHFRVALAVIRWFGPRAFFRGVWSHLQLVWKEDYSFGLAVEAWHEQQTFGLDSELSFLDTPSSKRWQNFIWGNE